MTPYSYWNFYLIVVNELTTEVQILCTLNLSGVMSKFHVVPIFLPVDLRPLLLYIRHKHVCDLRIKFLVPNSKNAFVIANKPNVNLFARSPLHFAYNQNITT